jgi:uncharacterized membrane protein YphA (DoxX/SURF4 family)
LWNKILLESIVMNIKWIGFLRIVVGIYFLVHGLNRIEWFRTSEILREELHACSSTPYPAAQWVQKRVVLPYIEIWARLVPAGELLVGAALIVGLLSRTALILSIAMTLLYHTATGKIFTPLFVSDAAGMLLLALLTMLAFLRSGSVFAVRPSRR